jgi:preprotein translocase subunit Sec63
VDLEVAGVFKKLEINHAGQLRGVETITRASNLYEVLIVEKSSSQAEIIKSYRKLIMKFHPDKNAAPGVDQALTRR